MLKLTKLLLVLITTISILNASADTVYDNLVDTSGLTTHESDQEEVFRDSLTFGNIAESNSSNLIEDDRIEHIRLEGNKTTTYINTGYDRGDEYSIDSVTGEKIYKVNENNSSENTIDYEKIKELNITEDTDFSNLDKSYLTFEESYYIYTKGTDKQKEQMQSYIEGKVFEENYKESDVKRKLGQFYNTSNAMGMGYGFAGELREQDPEKFYEKDDNSTDKKNLYEETFGMNNGYLIQNSELTDNNYGTISKAYKSLNGIKESLLNKLDDYMISCQISRDLIPSFYCPLSGKSNIHFPNSSSYSDMRKVNIESARKECDEFCVTDPGTLDCLSQRILDDEEITFNLKNLSNSSNIAIFPNYDQENTIFFYTPFDFMPVKTIDYDIKVMKDANSSISDAQLEDWLKENPLRLNIKIQKLSNFENQLPEDVIPQTYTNVNSRFKTSSIRLSHLFKKTMAVKFFKPYIDDIKEEQQLFLSNNGIKIIIENIRGEYESDSYHFCQKQFVSSPSDCAGLTVEMTFGQSQFAFLCVEEGKLVGPDPVWGAFYSQESCNAQCLYDESCKHTYFNTTTSTSSESTMFKTTIDCVDKDENSNCNKELCESWFLSDRTPINEIVYDKEENPVFTIKNHSIVGTRPKIDVVSELNASENTDFDEMFKKEEKDIAYKNMLANLSYNRFAYKIGEVSPTKMAYVISSDRNKNTGYQLSQGIVNDRVLNLSVKLKPQSDHIDNNKSYYLYNILSIEQNYSPRAGNYYIDGNNISILEFGELKFRDRTLVLLDGESNNSNLKIFYRQQNYKVYTPTVETVLDETTGTVSTKTTYNWNDTPSFEVKRYEDFVDSNGSMVWNSISSSDNAEYFKYQKFSSATDYQLYNTSEDLMFDIKSKKGLLIRKQDLVNNNLSIRKVYSLDESYMYSKGILHNIKAFLIYSENRLTYNDLVDKLISNPNTLDETNNHNKYTYYDHLSPYGLTKDEIPYDVEINNNIKGLLLGDSNSSTFSIKMEPRYSKEYGKKQFKFLFLYDPEIDESLDN